MKVSILTSAYILKYPSLVDAIKNIAALGYDEVDIAAWYPHAEPRLMNKKVRRELRDVIADAGLRLNQIATMGDPSNGIWPEMEAFIDAQRERLDLAADLGARCVEVLPGFTRPDLPRELTWEWAVNAYKRLSEHAEDVGIPLCLEFEPHQPTQYLWGRPMPMNAYDLKTFRQMIEDVGHPSFKANLDIGHCNIIAKGEPESIKGDLWALKDYLISTHCNDNDGITDLNAIPGRGTCDFKYYFKELHAMGYRGPISIELEGEDEPEAAASESLAYIKGLLQETDLYG